MLLGETYGIGADPCSACGWRVTVKDKAKPDTSKGTISGSESPASRPETHGEGLGP